MEIINNIPSERKCMLQSLLKKKVCKKSLKIPKGQPESVYRRRTDKRKSTKRQTTIHKTHTQNQRSSNTNPTKNRGWTQVLWKG